jgi:hypothetical protein
MSEMVERVAMAMHNFNRIQQSAQCLAGGHVIPKDYAPFKLYDELNADEKEYVCKVARAAITAMRVPTANMVDNAPFRDLAETTWEFMIDEALK